MNVPIIRKTGFIGFRDTGTAHDASLEQPV